MTARHPTKRLFDPNPDTRLQYVNSDHTDLRAKWADFFKTAHEPETAQSVQASAVAERQTMNIRSFKR